MVSSMQDNMTAFDKFLGVILATFALVLFNSDQHYIVYVLVTIAAAVYTLFVVPGPRRRSVHDGHFYRTSVAEHLVRKFKRR